MATVMYEEQRLVEALRNRDEAAFEYLFDRYSASMVRIARPYVRSAAVADEVVQEAWLGVLEGIDRFESRSSLKTWIFRILTNIAKTRGERESRTLPLSALDNAEMEPSVDSDRFLDESHRLGPHHWALPPARFPEEQLLARETLAVVKGAIESLPATQRAVISLRDVDGWSSEETCNALELSETNQRVLLHRARSRVRQALEDYFRG